MLQLAIPMICVLAGSYMVGRGLINHMQKVLHPMSEALTRLTASVGALVDQLTENNAELTAVADALRSISGQPSVNPEDTAALNALADRLDAATDTAKAAADAAASAMPSPAATVTVSPTSITGASGGDQVTGQFTADGGQAPYTFAGTSDTLTDFTLEADGSFSITAATSETGTATVTATDANGVASAPTTVSVSIT